jgi:hypothetical protein
LSWPHTSLRSIGAGTIATAPTREADVSSDRLSSIVGPEPESANQQFRKKEMPTSTSSRSADQAARAGRSASELARKFERLVRAREGCE